MGRKYFQPFTVATSVTLPTQLCSVKIPANKFMRITRFAVSCSTSPLPTNQQIPLTCGGWSGTYTEGIGGAAGVIVKRDPGDSAAVATTRVGDTTPSLIGTGAASGPSFQFNPNVYQGTDQIPDEPWPYLNAEEFVLVALATGTIVTLNGYVEWEEIGG